MARASIVEVNQGLHKVEVESRRSSARVNALHFTSPRMGGSHISRHECHVLQYHQSTPLITTRIILMAPTAWTPSTLTLSKHVVLLLQKLELDLGTGHHHRRPHMTRSRHHSQLSGVSAFGISAYGFILIATAFALATLFAVLVYAASYLFST
jgi:hypothetical protein